LTRRSTSDESSSMTMTSLTLISAYVGYRDIFTSEIAAA